MTAAHVLDADDTPEARDRRTRAYLRRGSTTPEPGKCGSRLAGPGASEPHRTLNPDTPWRYCLQRPLKGRERCKHHGGMSLAGPAHPGFKTGIYSAAFAGTPLEAGYLAFATDDELLSVRENIRLLNARSRQLVTRAAAANGESGVAWARADAAVRMLGEAIRLGDAERATEATRELEAVVLRGAAAERDWQEERAISEVHRRLVETQHRLIERGKHVIPVDQAIQHSAQIAALAVPHITAGRCRSCLPAGRQELSEFANELRALADGGGVTEENGRS